MNQPIGKQLQPVANMVLFKKAKDLHKWLDAQRQNGKKIGFVPTMGALHKGHISLLKTSIENNKVSVCSIFVNPTQFNDPKDFTKYPITIEKDILLLENNGCDVLFLPSLEEIYPDGVAQNRHYELGELEFVFEGKFRPGHFQGVCMVVHRLLEIVKPDNLYLGQKDYQQCMVIKKLIELIGMSDKITINTCPTLREPDGLAMSSRNMRLSEKERAVANTIYQCLIMIKEKLQLSETLNLLAKANKILKDAGFRPDYFALTDAGTLSPVSNWDGKQRLVVIAAVYLNETRLIDNMLIN